MNEASSSLEFQDHFHLSPSRLKKILDLALSRGGDFSEIYLEHKSFHFIKMEEDIIKETIAQLGENIVVRRFTRFRIGEE